MLPLLPLRKMAFGVMLSLAHFAVAMPGSAQTITFEALGDLPGGGINSSAAAVSADGATVVGRSSVASGSEGFRWRNGVMTGIGFLPATYQSSQAAGVSADGSIVVGVSSSTRGTEAFSWSGGSMTPLGAIL